MPPLRYIGRRTATGVQDSAAAGNINPYLPGTGWDVVFTPDVINVQDTEFEVYQIALDGPIGSSAVLLLDGQEFS